jgi:hypothetical protein
VRRDARNKPAVRCLRADALPTTLHALGQQKVNTVTIFAVLNDVSGYHSLVDETSTVGERWLFGGPEWED